MIGDINNNDYGFYGKPNQGKTPSEENLMYSCPNPSIFGPGKEDPLSPSVVAMYSAVNPNLPDIIDEFDITPVKPQNPMEQLMEMFMKFMEIFMQMFSKQNNGATDKQTTDKQTMTL